VVNTRPSENAPKEFAFYSLFSCERFILDTRECFGVVCTEEHRMSTVEINFESKHEGQPFLRADLRDDGMILLHPINPRNPQPDPDVIEPWMVCWA